jgi:hypothetical protein
VAGNISDMAIQSKNDVWLLTENRAVLVKWRKEDGKKYYPLSMFYINSLKNLMCLKYINDP